MDGATFSLAVFLVGTFAATFVAALAGFALGVVALAIWLYAISPVQAAALVAAYALIVQGYAVWKLRHSINVRRLLPFILGGAIGIPAGVAVLKWASPIDLRNAVGVLLVLFALYNLARPQLPQVRRAGSFFDGVVGVVNGVVGASTGLGGTLPAIWCGMRGWNKDEQRAVFQPAAVATFLMMILWLGGAGMLDADIGWLFVIGLPALLAGTWLGWKLYGRLDEARFRKIVVYVVLVSGVALVAIVDRGGKPNHAVSAVPPPAVVPWSSTRDVLRVKFDPVYDRVWVLGHDHVDVYYRPTRKLIRRVVLPAWSVADFICEPDIAFDRAGIAFISHNLQPRLWQIDPDTFELKEHAVRLLEREILDVGFGSLAFARDGALFGVASSGRSVWRIDLTTADAREVHLAQMPMDDCALPTSVQRLSPDNT